MLCYVEVAMEMDLIKEQHSDSIFYPRRQTATFPHLFLSYQTFNLGLRRHSQLSLILKNKYTPVLG